MPDSPASVGLFDSLKALTASVVDVVQTRLSLLALDIAEERAHLTRLALLTLVALFCAGLGMAMLAMLVVVIFWDTHRLLALATVSGVFLAAGVALAVFTLRQSRNRLRLFESSLAEFAKDLHHLRRTP